MPTRTPENARLDVTVALSAVTEIHDAITRALGRSLTTTEVADLTRAHDIVDGVWRSIQARVDALTTPARNDWIDP